MSTKFATRQPDLNKTLICLVDASSSRVKSHQLYLYVCASHFLSPDHIRSAACSICHLVQKPTAGVTHDDGNANPGASSAITLGAFRIFSKTNLIKPNPNAVCPAACRKPKPSIICGARRELNVSNGYALCSEHAVCDVCCTA